MIGEPLQLDLSQCCSNWMIKGSKHTIFQQIFWGPSLGTIPIYCLIFLQVLKHHYPLVPALENHIFVEILLCFFATFVSCVTIWGTSILEVCCCAAPWSAILSETVQIFETYDSCISLYIYIYLNIILYIYTCIANLTLFSHVKQLSCKRT